MWTQTIVCLLFFTFFGHSYTTDDKTKFPRPYQFGYTVSDKTTGDIKSHREESDGREVRGSYSVVEPTGALRVVTYTADKSNGFRATVNTEPRGETRRLTTPTYRLIKLPLLKLRRQHDEPTETSSAASTAKYDEQPEHITPSELQRENNTSGDTVPKDNQSENAPQSEYQIEIGGPFDKETFNSDHLESSPQVIPVKVEEDAAGSQVQEPVLKVDIPLKPTTIEGVDVKTTQEIEQESDKTGVISAFPIITKNDSEWNTHQQSVIKSMVQLHELNSDTQPTIHPSVESVFTTIGSKTSPPKVPEPTKTTENGKNQIPKTNSTSQTSGNGLQIADMNQNMMLAALLLPTTPILKFTCTPDHSDKNSMPMNPTMPNFAPTMNQRSPHPVSLGPGGSVYTPGLPLLPFHLVNFSPIKQIFSTPQTNKFPAQKPVSVFATKPPFLTFPTAFFQNTKPPVGAVGTFPTGFFHHTKPTGTFLPLIPTQKPIVESAPTQNPTTKKPILESVPAGNPTQKPVEATVTKNPNKEAEAHPHNSTTTHKDQDALVKVKPPNGYTNLRPESYAHKVQSSHYTPHLLPPPWAPHPLPLRQSHSHYRHMPIFVLPMSHNFNYAPTFDPALLDQHNH